LGDGEDDLLLRGRALGHGRSLGSGLGLVRFYADYVLLSLVGLVPGTANRASDPFGGGAGIGGLVGIRRLGEGDGVPEDESSVGLDLDAIVDADLGFENAGCSTSTLGERGCTFLQEVEGIQSCRSIVSMRKI
jgi:hypothetical protein